MGFNIEHPVGLPASDIIHLLPEHLLYYAGVLLFIVTPTPLTYYPTHHTT